MVLKYSQQDEGEITLTDYDSKHICIIYLTEVKVDKEPNCVMLNWDGLGEWDIGLLTQPMYIGFSDMLCTWSSDSRKTLNL